MLIKMILAYCSCDLRAIRGHSNYLTSYWFPHHYILRLAGRLFLLLAIVLASVPSLNPHSIIISYVMESTTIQASDRRCVPHASRDKC